jgi:hypothetical protein
VQGCNAIGEEGAKYIAEAIEKNDVVEGYWLKRNQIGLAGLQAILSALRTNQSYGCSPLTRALKLSLAGLS